MNKAIFLDRDGVINEDIDNLYRVEDIKMIKDIFEILKIFKQKDFKLIVISNQPIIARGLATEEKIEEIHKEINLRIKNESGIEIDKFFFCPHHPNANIEQYRVCCNCRKPAPGLIIQAAIEFNIDLSQSWMIGDRISDVVAGKNAGCKTILIEKGYSKNKIEGKNYDINTNPDFIVNNLKEITGIIK